jgi:SAM-dependent methyltransferase
MITALKNWCRDPRCQGMDLDHPSSTEALGQIARSNPALQRCYHTWYASLAKCMPADGRVLEIGSGSAVHILRQHIPHAITSDVRPVAGVDLVFDACRLPFGEGSLSGIVMANVFHHLHDCRSFLNEASRCVRPGGCVAMIEPWCTPWSRLVYRLLHHEPFEPDRKEWDVCGNGPATAANMALPWIVFQRDRLIFAREFPQWRAKVVRLLMPLSYVLSGGLMYRSPIPDRVQRLVAVGERAMPQRLCAMFALVTLHRAGSAR